MLVHDRGVRKSGGGQGWADVWMRDHFAWEYKGKRKSLADAYQQLQLYREALDNPPLLVVCDLDRFEVHTNFTNTATTVHEFDLAHLAEPANLDVLRKLFKRRDVDEIVNGCDAGREGELIFDYIYSYLGSQKPVRRLWVSSMTKDAIRAAGVRRVVAAIRDPDPEARGGAEILKRYLGLRDNPFFANVVSITVSLIGVFVFLASAYVVLTRGRDASEAYVQTVLGAYPAIVGALLIVPFYFLAKRLLGLVG